MSVTADEARFEEIFTAHYGSLMRYAARRVGVDAAQEVVAETFLLAWRRLDDVPANSLPWLFGAARRIAANELRRRGRAHRLGERVIEWGVVDQSDYADALSEQLRVRAALAALSERDREVLLLAEWEQLTTVEIAAVLRCGSAAAKVRLHRARRRFADLLGSDGTDVSMPRILPQGGTS
jgi:RNA polymerase sigma-70 factor, ECF subfamily